MSKKLVAAIVSLAVALPGSVVLAKKPGMEPPPVTAAVEAGDPEIVGADVYEKVLDNDRVRMFEVTFAPGASVPLHSHPDHAAYVLTGGTLRVAVPGSAPQEFTLTPGQALFLEAQTHEAVNVGRTTVKVLVVELK